MALNFLPRILPALGARRVLTHALGIAVFTVLLSDTVLM